MKFNYPYKLYFVGLILFTLVSAYIFFQIIYLPKINTILIVLYVIFSIAVLLHYYENYSYYKNMYILILNESIEIKKGHLLEKIMGINIDCIIEANHIRLFKVHNVVHIFTKDGKYFYLTNEINSFKELKKELNDNFKDVYIKREKAISSNFVVNKENLMTKT